MRSSKGAACVNRLPVSARPSNARTLNTLRLAPSHNLGGYEEERQNRILQGDSAAIKAIGIAISHRSIRIAHDAEHHEGQPDRHTGQDKRRLGKEGQTLQSESKRGMQGHGELREDRQRVHVAIVTLPPVT